MNYQGTYGAYPGNDGQSVGFSMDGNFYYSGSVVQSGLPTWSAANDLIDVAVDLSNGLIWIRVNGFNWNNNLYANPAIGTGGLPLYGLTSFYPVLSPGNNSGQMTILNSPYFLIPEGFQFIGANVTASLGFKRSTSLTEASFIEVANSISGQDFASGNAASTWLTDNGYWNNWSNFGSSGFQWMTIGSVTGSSATGVGQNSIGITINQSGGGMGQHSGMYAANTFPEQYGVPFNGIQILNQAAGTFTAIFSQPVTDPLVAFASVGQPGLQVPVQVSAPFTPIFSQATTYQNAVNGTQYTQFTGTEGFNIIRIDGTVQIVSFVYTVSEYYCTVCFGFVDQNA
jgi:hypothetical protein